MRSILLLFVPLFTLDATAQRGKPTFEEHSTMINDSLRQVERIDIKTGSVVDRRYFVDERPVGIWQEYDIKGLLLVQRDFDIMRYGAVPDMDKGATKGDSSMTIVETMPMFPGGEAELFKFLGRNIQYPQEAVDSGASGVVYLVGMVEENGDWKTISILRGVHPLIDYEAWRVTELMPDWTPGIVDGKPSRIQYNLPIRFTLR